MTLRVDVVNLFDAKDSGIDYCYASRLPNVPLDGANDIHLRPTLPRTGRVNIAARFLSPQLRGLDDPDANARTMDALMTDLPVVCTLSAEGLRARRQGLLTQVARRATRMTKIPAGYRFEFDAGSDTLSLIATMIDAERQCCRFLQFELSVDPDFGPLTLTLKGPEGTQQFLEALLDGA